MIYFKKIIDITKIQSYNAVIEHEDVLNDHLRALFYVRKRILPAELISSNFQKITKGANNYERRYQSFNCCISCYLG